MVDATVVAIVTGGRCWQQQVAGQRNTAVLGEGEIWWLWVCVVVAGSQTGQLGGSKVADTDSSCQQQNYGEEEKKKKGVAVVI